mmetsp:Transcript_4804/g.17165  ORF Transcript_4804/g.17165 Transcript_4804/m.17165 type:complete len:250 (-) Transcript_4804:1212-1961(-)
MNALSASASNAPDAIFRIASTIAASIWSSRPLAASSTRPSSSARVSVWPASQRLNASESLDIRKMRSSCVRSVVSFTGAEKFRRMDGVGFSATFVNVNVLDASSSRSDLVVSGAASASLTSSPSSVNGMSTPSGPTRPTAIGISVGVLFVCPGVSGMLCVHFISNVFFVASYLVFTSSAGVPAWVYHGRNASRLTSLASAIAARKSSVVTAWPSCLLKYRSMPFLNPSFPRRVSYMRTTSAPFSYTVTV